MSRCSSSSWTGLATRSRLDFGDSLFLGMPVTEALLERAQPTLLLTTYALLIEILIGVPAGVIAAIKRNSLIDRWLMVMSIAGAAIPTFFLGIVLILIFAVRLQWLPSGGYVPIQEDPQAHFKVDDSACLHPRLLSGRVAGAAGALVDARCLA